MIEGRQSEDQLLSRTLSALPLAWYRGNAHGCGYAYVKHHADDDNDQAGCYDTALVQPSDSQTTAQQQDATADDAIADVV